MGNIDKNMNERYHTFIGITGPKLSIGSHSEISVKENGVSYTITNGSDFLSSAIFSIDDGIETRGEKVKKCDKYIMLKRQKDQWYEIFVELKGGKVNDAIKQLYSTLEQVQSGNQLLSEEDYCLFKDHYPCFQGVKRLARYVISHEGQKKQERPHEIEKMKRVLEAKYELEKAKTKFEEQI